MAVNNADINKISEKELTASLREKIESAVTKFEVLHSKTGTVHTLSGVNMGEKLYTTQFIATDNYNSGDTFDGWIITTTGQLSELPDYAFVLGDLVSIVVDTESMVISFNINDGGTGGESGGIPTLNITHTKEGTVHSLTGLNTEIELYHTQFRASATYNSGDTFDGWIIAITGPTSNLPDKAFTMGDLVNITVDNISKVLSFTTSVTSSTTSSGGSGEIADGSITTAKFAADATTPNAAKLDGKSASDFVSTSFGLANIATIIDTPNSLHNILTGFFRCLENSADTPHTGEFNIIHINGSNVISQIAIDANGAMYTRSITSAADATWTTWSRLATMDIEGDTLKVYL